MNLFQRNFDIRSSSDPERAIETIREGVSIRGYNLWLLFCAAALASIGLDTNSTAVIIGAMLISPLISPILGVGLSFGLHDRSLLLRSVRNLGAAVVLSLTASVLYFLISPFGNLTSEMEARTYPTLLDVLVALFGGIAGIVSYSRTGVSNAVPGVAIATALMPPLCTAGFGLATQQWHIFGGAFYLFLINAVFISLATYAMVKYLRFPVTTYPSLRQRRYYSIVFTVLIILATLPSAYFLYTVYQKEIVRRRIEALVFDPIRRHGNEIFRSQYTPRDSAIVINIYHSGKPIGDSLLGAIREDLKSNGLGQYWVKPHRVNLTREEINELSAETSRQMYQQLQLEEIGQDRSSAVPDSFAIANLTNETRIAFPFIDTLYNGVLNMRDSTKRDIEVPIIIYEVRALQPGPEQQNALNQYLKARLKADTIILMKRQTNK